MRSKNADGIWRKWRVLQPCDFLIVVNERDTAEFRRSFAQWLVSPARIEPFRLLLAGLSDSECSTLLADLGKLRCPDQVQQLNKRLLSLHPDSPARSALARPAARSLRDIPELVRAAHTTQPPTEIPLAQVEWEYFQDHPSEHERILDQLHEEELGTALVSKCFKKHSRFAWADGAGDFRLVAWGIRARPDVQAALLRQHQHDPKRLRLFLDRLLAEQTLHYLRHGRFACPAELSDPLNSMVHQDEAHQDEARQRDYSDICLGFFGRYHPHKASPPAAVDPQFTAALLCLYVLDSHGLIRFLAALLKQWTRIYRPRSKWLRSYTWAANWAAATKLNRRRKEALNDDAITEEVAKLSGEKPTPKTIAALQRFRRRTLKLHFRR